MNLQKKKGRSAQEFLGVKGFTAYGLATAKAELVFYLVSPTNISVLSAANVEIKVRHLKAVLQAAPEATFTIENQNALPSLHWLAAQRYIEEPT